MWDIIIEKLPRQGAVPGYKAAGRAACLPDERGLAVGLHSHRALCDCSAQGEQRGQDQDAHAVILPSKLELLRPNAFHLRHILRKRAAYMLH